MTMPAHAEVKIIKIASHFLRYSENIFILLRLNTYMINTGSLLSSPYSICKAAIFFTQ